MNDDEQAELDRRVREYEHRQNQKNEKIAIFVVGFIVAAWLMAAVVIFVR